MSGCSDLQLAQGLRPLARDPRRWEHSLGRRQSLQSPNFRATSAKTDEGAGPEYSRPGLAFSRATFSTAQKRVEIDSTRGHPQSN